MKRLEFEEGEFPDLQSIAERMFMNSEDPTSPAYQRVLHRPRISWLRIALSWVIPMLISAAAALCMAHAGADAGWALGSIVTGWVLYGLIRAKAAVLCLVRIYQRYAPESVRRKCRFEPSCSVYMIQAVEKYGVVRGLRKGFARLGRCRPGFGGFEPLD